MWFSTRVAAVAAASLFCASGPLMAESLNVCLDQANEEQSHPDGTSFIKVSISDGVAGAIDFRVEILGSFSSRVGNSGIQSFSFNFGDSGATIDNLVLPDDRSVKNKKAGKGVQHSEFGKFDTQVAGNGSSRHDPLEFSIVGVAGDRPADYVSALSSGKRPVIFAAHVEVEDGLHGHFGGSEIIGPDQYCPHPPVYPRLALAYIDQNNNRNFDGAPDVIIAELLDVDENGPSPGDMVLLNRYPLSFNPCPDSTCADTGSFGIREFTVTNVASSSATIIEVTTGEGTFEWIDVPSGEGFRADNNVIDDVPLVGVNNIFVQTGTIGSPSDTVSVFDDMSFDSDYFVVVEIY